MDGGEISSSDTLDSGDSDMRDLLEMYERIQRGYHVLVDESIHTEEIFREFVLSQEEVRRKWYVAESESRRYCSTAQNSETEHDKAQGHLRNIRQQLQNEMERRIDAEDRIRTLERILDTFRDVLGGGNIITDEQRQRLFRDVDDVTSRNTAYNSRIWTGIRKSEDIDTGRISFDRSDEDLLDDSEEDQATETATTRTSNSRRASNRNANGEYTQTKRMSVGRKMEYGDMELITKTHVLLPQKGPVEARLSLTQRPARRSVGFLDVSERRSQSAPRTVEQPDARFRHSRTSSWISLDQERGTGDNTTFLSCEQSSVGSETESGGDGPVHQRVAAVIHPPFRERRSMSVGTGLDQVIHHDFEKKTAKSFDKKCSAPACRAAIGLYRSAWQCTQCLLWVHERCQSLAPMPCHPVRVDPNADRAGGQWINLENIAPRVHPRVPSVFVQLVRFIDEHGVQQGEEGLYRVAGSVEQVKQLKRDLLKNNFQIRMDRVLDVHLACSLLTNLLKSLSEPLLTRGLWARFVDAASHSRHDSMYNAINSLPLPNRDTLAYLMQHFRRVADAAAVRMPVDNLVKVLAMSIVGNSKSPEQLTERDISGEMMKQHLVMRKLMDLQNRYWGDLLGPDNSVSGSSTGNSNGHGVPPSPENTPIYRAPHDRFLEEGMKGGSSFSSQARQVFGSMNSKKDNRSRTMRPQPGSSKFQSPMMSD